MNKISRIFFCLVFFIMATSPVFSEDEFKPMLNISGYGQFRMLTSHASSGFSINNVVLDFNGTVFKDADFKVELNATAFAHDETFKGVQEFYFDWHPSKKFGIRIGKQFMFHTASKDPSEWESIEYPISTDLATIYDTGIMVYGKPLNFLEYRVGIVNGSESLTDFSGNKHLVWNLNFKPLSWLSFGVASQSNRGYYEDNRMDHPYILNHFGRRRISAHFSAEGDVLASGLNTYLLIEYLSEESENDSGKGGLYLLFTQYVTRKIQLVIVSENFDRGLDGEKVYVSNAVGINYFPEKNIKLQASYVWVRDSADRLLAQLQVSF